MVANSRNVTLGKGDKAAGTVLRAPAGTPLPADVNAAASAAFLDHGLIGEDGIKLKYETSTEGIKDMNGDVVRTIKTETVVGIEIPLLELNLVSAQSTFGEDNVVVTQVTADTDNPAGELITIKMNSADAPPSAWVINLKDMDRRIRVTCALATPTTSGEMSFKGGEPIILPISLSPMPDENGDMATIEVFTPSAA